MATIAAAALVAVLAGCGEAARFASVDAGEQVLPTGEKVFPSGEVMWAQGSTIHVGDETYDVGGYRIEAFEWSPYGLFVRTVDDGAKFYDGSELRDIPGDVREVAVSSDGRYAAWIDFDGPEAAHGEIAALVVADLSTGKSVVRTREGLGDESDDIADLYEELPPSVEWFKDGAVVWQNAEGTRARTDFETGATAESDDQSAHPEHDEEPDSTSPDGQYGYYYTQPGNSLSVDDLMLRIEDMSSGADVTPQLEASTMFGGWLDGGRFLAVAGTESESSYRLSSCDIASGECDGLRTITAPGLVLPAEQPAG